MTAEIMVILTVLAINALIFGSLIWSFRRGRTTTFAERRQQALEKLGIKGFFFAILLTWFSGYQLYQSFTTEQLYYGGRIGKGLELTLTDHPAIFAVLAVLYSSCFFFFGAAVLFAIFECLQAMREP